MRFALMMLSTLLATSCAPHFPMLYFDEDEQCWVQDRPDVDISSCNRNGNTAVDTDLIMIDDQGRCWELPYCGGWPTWEGWSRPEQDHICVQEWEQLPRCDARSTSGGGQ